MSIRMTRTVYTVATASTVTWPDQTGYDWLYFESGGMKLKASIDGGPQFPCIAGFPIDHSFSTLALTNNDTVDRQIAFVVGAGIPMPQQRAPRHERIVGVIAVADQVVGAGAQAKVAAGSPAVAGFKLSMADGAANGVRVGGSTAAANHGVNLPVGEVMEFPGNVDLYVYNPGAAAVTLTVLELQTN